MNPRRHQAADLLRAAAKMRLEREALARQQQELHQPPSREAHDRDDLNELRHESFVGNGCSCKTSYGRARGTVMQ
jgi:hypothetical protein